MTATDDMLIRRCCDGDEEAWDALLRRYGPLVRAVPRRYNLPPDVCDDVCQSVFQTLVESLPHLRSASSLAGWLATVARRHSLRHLQPVGHGPLTPADLQEPPNETLQNWEERCQLKQAIESLPDFCRDLIHAFFLDHTAPSYAEIARRLDRPIGSLGPMRRRCLTRLARLLLPTFEEPQNGQDGAPD